MEIIKERYFEDREGKKKEVIYKSGLKEITLLEPSDEYIETEIKPRIEIAKRQEQREERERKVQEKMREIAEEELEKEGKL